MSVEQPEGGRDELADLRAEVERLREELADAREDAEAVRSDLANAADSCEQEEARAEKAEDERDDALARLAVAEGVARTNAAWVQQQHAAAKEAQEQRDALQRQATRVRRYVESKAVTSRARGRTDEERDWLDVLALLDAVEPADQPHPTPKTLHNLTCDVCAAGGEASQQFHRSRTFRVNHLTRKDEAGS